jgi:hypothetical protein
MDAFLAKHSKVPKTEDVRFESEKQRMTFGRHKNKTFGEIFDTDLMYVCWVLKTNEDTRKYFKKFYTYCKDRIELEAKEQ